MRSEQALAHIRQQLAIEHAPADGPQDHLCTDLCLYLMRTYGVTNFTAERLIDQVRAEQAAKLAAG